MLLLIFATERHEERLPFDIDVVKVCVVITLLLSWNNVQKSEGDWQLELTGIVVPGDTPTYVETVVLPVILIFKFEIVEPEGIPKSPKLLKYRLAYELDKALSHVRPSVTLQSFRFVKDGEPSVVTTFALLKAVVSAKTEEAKINIENISTKNVTRLRANNLTK